jgi:hypothetical protein
MTSATIGTKNCQGVHIHRPANLAAATSSRPQSLVRRIPIDSISAAANGPTSPYRKMPMAAENERVARSQPKLGCSGIISTPGVARRPDDTSSARNITATINRICRRGSPARSDTASGSFSLVHRHADQKPKRRLDRRPCPGAEPVQQPDRARVPSHAVQAQASSSGRSDL